MKVYRDPLLQVVTVTGRGVDLSRDTPKWMVKIMENPIKIDDWGENHLIHLFLETPIYRFWG